MHAFVRRIKDFWCLWLLLLKKGRGLASRRIELLEDRERLRHRSLRILCVLDSDRVIVSGVNMMKKHTKPNPQAGVAGGIVEQEAPIQASNLAVYNSKSGKGERVGYRDEDGKKVRVFKPSGDLVDA